MIGNVIITTMCSLNIRHTVSHKFTYTRIYGTHPIYQRNRVYHCMSFVERIKHNILFYMTIYSRLKLSTTTTKWQETSDCWSFCVVVDTAHVWGGPTCKSHIYAFCVTLKLWFDKVYICLYTSVSLLLIEDYNLHLPIVWLVVYSAVNLGESDIYLVVCVIKSTKMICDLCF